MQTDDRRPAASVMARLLDAPYRFQLIPTVRLLLQWLSRHGVPRSRAWEYVLRFHNSTCLNFPPSEIEGIQLTGVNDWQQVPSVLRAQGSVRIDITPRLIGLLGVNGTLPWSYTERIVAHAYREKTVAARAFIDVLSQRMVALYCQAWERHRLEHAAAMDGTDRQLELLLSLAGTPRQALADRLIPADAAAHYAGLLRTRPISASALANIVQGYFNVPVQVRQFVGGWDHIPAPLRSTLGPGGPTLGYGAALGVRMWRQDRRLRLLVGPLDADALERFLPRGDASRTLAHLLTLLSVPGLIYELQVLLAPDCVTPLKLGARKRLGWDSFLLAGPQSKPAKTLCYQLDPA
ncbi:type VI secretion system baseplate subunit TssG [Duganella callida]|uniref:Type VI secretion system baseplate subunit TssG n=1 Tax=Duganella callida TaxID=2561932 RepID=A0A4Y9SV80_9BURK|nr:type VI secretion system baseplate subunit TssG [Duganella callida]TFW30375.1 type VI secretion system baseplate subunit TssG [Duganella callida]